MKTNLDNNLDRIIKGIEIYNEKLLKNKKERNLDVVISENGKIVRIKAVDL